MVVIIVLLALLLSIATAVAVGSHLALRKADERIHFLLEDNETLDAGWQATRVVLGLAMRQNAKLASTVQCHEISILLAMDEVERLS